ncbi:MAG: DUF4091 domain-containing protein [Andreesenia angusta]|nr:DUF4091 domain-containing protein [Andreesenia angusta]
MQHRREFRFKAGLQASDYRHVKFRHFTDEDWSIKTKEIYIGKEEYFSQQIILNALNGETLYSISNKNLISWRGLINRIRMDIEIEEESLKDCFKLSFMQYISNDLNVEVAEPIGDMDFIEAEDGITQAVILEGKIPKEYDKDNLKLKINFYLQNGFEEEKKIETLELDLKIYDFVFEDLRSSNDFILDLWQHPSSWARYYEVGLWSEDHFKIIENMLEELASMGNKIITVIASDFPWSGQLCDEVMKNPSNLYEYNMIETIRDINGDFIFDYSIMDRYIDIAMSVGIDKEIDIFGFSGIWEMGMGSPFEDCPEPIKISYFDKKTGTIKYIKKEEELRLYLKSLIEHLKEKGVYDITRIISDHPNDDEIFEERKKYIEHLVHPHRFEYKSAMYLEQIIRDHYKKLDELSLCSAALLQIGDDMPEIKKEINEKGGYATWYVCWFPERPNNFIESPLIDNRLIGWFTYLFGMDGFLRWDYALWTTDPWKDIRYKYPYWKAGDMFFVYPGRNMKPKRSLRWENLRYGIQDYQLFKRLEEIGYTRQEILERFVQPLLGEIKNYEVNNSRSVKIKYDENLSAYMKVKREILSILERVDTE